MKRNVIRRDEMLGATLELGGTPIALDEYATTGLLSVAIGPRGNGKTNAGLLLMAEQLSEQGWVSVLIDPENELESVYGDAVADPEALRAGSNAQPHRAGFASKLVKGRRRAIITRVEGERRERRFATAPWPGRRKGEGLRPRAARALAPAGQDAGREGVFHNYGSHPNAQRNPKSPQPLRRDNRADHCYS